jgi:hypothetical protein
MTRRLITSKLSLDSRAARLVAGIGAATLSVATMATLYACSGDDSSATTTPPLNDAGSDSSPVTQQDGAPNTNPEAGSDGAAPKPSCESLPGTIVYIESADTQEALLDAVGREMRDKANVTLVFWLGGSCTVTPDIYGGGSGSLVAGNSSMLYIPSTAENPSWTPADPESGCTLASAHTPDLGIAALFPSSCAGFATPPAGTNIAQYIGPTQAYTFIVPNAEFTNGQTSISAEEAYYVFGDGANNGITPTEWNLPNEYYLRPGTKSTLVSTALNIGLTAKEMTDSLPDGGTADGRNLVASSGGCESDVAAATTQAQAIGILGDEVYDSNRGAGVNILAFKAFGQDYAYFPDSTQTAYDKQNIRDGHYTLWSPDTYMAASSGGVPTNPTVQYILDVILGNPGATPPDGGAPIDALSITANVGLTPSCAMQVTRTADGAPVTPHTPAAPCTCKFLNDLSSKGVALPSSCTMCTTSADCGDAAGLVGCFNGYCETTPAPLTLTGNDAGACDDTTAVGINACTNATGISKTVTFGAALADGGLSPVTQ